MSNSLIQAAQRMYSAKYAEAQKDVTPIAKGISYLGANITEALDEKLKDQKKKAQESTESFKDIILKSGKARPELTRQLTTLQDEYFENIKISEGIFRNKEERSKAVNRNSEISETLKKWQVDLESQDLMQASLGEISDYEGNAGKLKELSFDKGFLAENIRFTENGVVTETIEDGEVKTVRLSEWTPPVTKNIQGVNDAAEIQTAALANAKQARNWDIEVKPSLVQGVDNILNKDNWQSLLFDNIQGVNWAKEEIKSRLGVDTEDELSQEYIDARQQLRDMVRSGKDENGNSFNWKHEFRNDVVNGTKLKYDELAKEYEDQQELSSGSGKNELNTITKQSYSPSAIQSYYRQLSSIKPGQSMKYTLLGPDATLDVSSISTKGGKSRTIYKTVGIVDPMDVTKKKESKSYNSFDEWWTNESGFSTANTGVDKMNYYLNLFK